jgi:hypothetical protein
LNDETALWLFIVTGVATAVVASVLGYMLLGLPFVRLKVRHVLRIDESGPRVESYVNVANVRGRPVRVQEVFLFQPHGKGRPPLGRPRGWEFGMRLEEGDAVQFTFERERFPNAKAVVIDSADRVWPRRRWFRVRGYGLRAGRMIGWPWQRNGPTDEQMRRAVERNL